MKKYPALLLSLPLVFSLSGCVVAVNDDFRGDHHSSWEETQESNRKVIAGLNGNESVEQIQDKLGVADFSELHEYQGNTVKVLFYRTHKHKSDGRTTKEECTPLVFKEGRLVGWGEKAYSRL
ncbi:DUF3192 domain-containing protein [Flocculibacter collagenilyticus]|uniref:DUF3192 domain-containing protein n=1 Tax=Flocculibacter collagenilyticus TaxID=2744479 RepID=UPI0018F32BE3|nr:DUF3192 domain-containing protein [Flocculibacter collagenilyticus]